MRACVRACVCVCATDFINVVNTVCSENSFITFEKKKKKKLLIVFVRKIKLNERESRRKS